MSSGPGTEASKEASKEAKPKIQFEAEPALDASNSVVRLCARGIRITFPNKQVKYYYGQGAFCAASAQIEFGPIPELEGRDAPKPSNSLVRKYGLSPTHVGIGAVGVGSLGATGSIGTTKLTFNMGGR